MRKYNKMRILTIILIIFSFPAVAIYLDYNSLVETDFLLGDVQFEARDLEDFVADKQEAHLLSGQASLPNLYEVFLFSCILTSSEQEILSCSESFILRC